MASRRKPKQKSGYLGTRHFGCGDVKNKRGSGNRGGRGNAGRCKHKGTWVAKYAPGYFGKHGFVNPTRKKAPVSQLYDINQKAVAGKLVKKDEKYYFEFKGKILGTGSVTVPLMIRALGWSRKTEEKVRQAGGQMEKIAASAAKSG
jgi:large subunit ribosomal protein L15